jgi:hypothetical protein
VGDVAFSVASSPTQRRTHADVYADADLSAANTHPDPCVANQATAHADADTGVPANAYTDTGSVALGVTKWDRIGDGASTGRAGTSAAPVVPERMRA